MLREMVEAIKSKSSRESFMYYERAGNGLEIVVCRDGERVSHTFASQEKDIYLMAIEKSDRIGRVSKTLRISSADVVSVLNGFERKG